MSRYYPPEKISDFVSENPQLPFKILGQSVEGRPIYGLPIGNGTKKILLWSQMHGNESTTTRALIQFLRAYVQGTSFPFLEDLKLYIILQLNPDGSKRFQRHNANDIDLNRDAQALTQPESQLLHQVFHSFQPDFALNLHGQRTIFAAGKGGEPATLSFLAPAADTACSLPPQRKIAMQVIAAIVDVMPTDLLHRIGRYDDTYNSNCVGDAFTTAGVPTLLFEAGHHPDDYQRNQTTAWVYKALLSCFECIASESYLAFAVADYLELPENDKGFVDMLWQNVNIQHGNTVYEAQQLAIQYQESLENNQIVLTPSFHSFGTHLGLRGHFEKQYDQHEKSTVIHFEANQRVGFLENITFD